MTEHLLSKHILIDFTQNPVVQNILTVAYFHPRNPHFGVFTWSNVTVDSTIIDPVKRISTGWDTVNSILLF